MTRPLMLLLVDDNPDDRMLVVREVRKVLPDAHVDEAADEATLVEWIEAGREWDVAVTDYQLRWSTGMDVFHRLQATRPGLPVIMFTASGSEELAVDALKQGVDDYITKTPKHYGRVPYAVQAAAERRRRQQVAAAAESAREQSDTLLKLALEAAAMETWEYDIAARQLTLHGRSPRLSGGVRRELSADALLQAMAPADIEAVRAQFRASADSNQRFEREFRMHIRNDLRWLRAAGLPDGRGRVVGVVEDITARKRAEESLHEADRRKDQFIATLAHELRNPLAPIRYAVRLLETGTDAAQIEHARTVIERQAAMMAGLLDQLLDLRRIAHGHFALTRTAVDLRAVARNAFEDAGALARASSHRLSLSMPDEPVLVDGDAMRLKQVLDNLVQNALKFTPAGGAIEIAVEDRADGALVRITDTGVGIAPEMLDKVFEPLVQVNAGPSAATRGGLGLGLAVARQLVELHGGRIAASSPGLGRGTTFAIQLPRFEAQTDVDANGPTVVPPPAPAPADTHTQPTSALRVLIADDQPDAAESLGMVLELEGHEVRIAFDGAQACEIAQQWQPDVMVLDIGMPQMGGDEVARWVRAQPWGNGVWLVAVTGWGRDEDRLQLQNAGFDLHLVKPVEVSRLLVAVRPQTTG